MFGNIVIFGWWFWFSRIQFIHQFFRYNRNIQTDKRSKTEVCIQRAWFLVSGNQIVLAHFQIAHWNHQSPRRHSRITSGIGRYACIIPLILDTHTHTLTGQTDRQKHTDTHTYRTDRHTHTRYIIGFTVAGRSVGSLVTMDTFWGVNTVGTRCCSFFFAP